MQFWWHIPPWESRGGTGLRWMWHLKGTGTVQTPTSGSQKPKLTLKNWFLKVGNCFNWDNVFSPCKMLSHKFTLVSKFSKMHLFVFEIFKPHRKRDGKIVNGPVTQPTTGPPPPLYTHTHTPKDHAHPSYIWVYLMLGKLLLQDQYIFEMSDSSKCLPFIWLQSVCVQSTY